MERSPEERAALEEYERMDPDQFARYARDILGEAVKFEDERLVITRHGEDIHITRKSMEAPYPDHLRGTNPVTMIDDSGQVFRHHGEHGWISRHLEQIWERAFDQA